MNLSSCVHAKSLDPGIEPGSPALGADALTSEPQGGPLSHFSRVQLCDPMDGGPPGSSLHGFSRQEYWSGLPCPPPDLPNPGIKPTSLTSPALAGRFFTTNATWEAPHYISVIMFKEKKNTGLKSCKVFTAGRGQLTSLLTADTQILSQRGVCWSIRCQPHHGALNVHQPRCSSGTELGSTPACLVVDQLLIS